MGDRVAPPKAADMIGIWLGQDEHHWAMVYRMELRADGHGWLSSRGDRKGPVHTSVYEIIRWDVTDGSFHCSLVPLRGALPLRMRGHAGFSYIDLDLSEVGDLRKWDPGPRMIREPEFLERLQQTQNWAVDLERTEKTAR
jgi:hypothetical protein